MNNNDRVDKTHKVKRHEQIFGFEILPRKTASILMEISNNGECRSVTSLDDSNIAKPISSDSKVRAS